MSTASRHGRPCPAHDGRPDRPIEYVNLFDPWYETSQPLNINGMSCGMRAGDAGAVAPARTIPDVGSPPPYGLHANSHADDCKHAHAPRNEPGNFIETGARRPCAARPCSHSAGAAAATERTPTSYRVRLVVR
jgi:hypothetical protein